MAPTEDDWRRLADHVTTRRTQLGLTQGQVQAAGGPSVATMRLIEGAIQEGYRPNILGRLEQALGWKAGSVAAILTGGEPTEIPGQPQPAHKSEPTWEDQLARIRAIANNPDRSPGLRAWARRQVGDIEAILEAAREEEDAQRRNAS